MPLEAAVHTEFETEFLTCAAKCCGSNNFELLVKLAIQAKVLLGWLDVISSAGV